MKTKLLVEGWKDYLNQESYYNKNNIFLNEKEINSLVEAYDLNKTKAKYLTSLLI